MSKNNLIDTNLIIRFLTLDDLQKAGDVKKLLSSGKTFFMPEVVFAEIVWVLSSYYGFGKDEIYEKLKSLLSFRKISCNRSLLFQALENYNNFGHLDFVDCYLAALAKEDSGNVLYSYDKGFDKVMGVKRLEP